MCRYNAYIEYELTNYNEHKLKQIDDITCMQIVKKKT